MRIRPDPERLTGLNGPPAAHRLKHQPAAAHHAEVDDGKS
jgi:hypothetical protein